MRLNKKQPRSPCSTHEVARQCQPSQLEIMARPCSKRFRRELAISQNLHEEARTFLFRAEGLRGRRDGARIKSSMKRFTISRRVLSTLSLWEPYDCIAPERPLEPPQLKSHGSSRPSSTLPQSVHFPNCQRPHHTSVASPTARFRDIPCRSCSAVLRSKLSLLHSLIHC